MRFRKEDYIHLRVVSNPEADFGFDVVDAATGRPLAGISNLVFERGINQMPVYHKPHEVRLTLVGIPVELNTPDWETFARHRAAAQEREQREAEAAEGRRAVAATQNGGVTPLPPSELDAESP